MAGDRNTRIGVCLAKLEATIGTDPVPTAALNALLLTDPLGDPGGTFAIKSARDKALTGMIQGLPGLQMQGRIATWPLKCQARGTRNATAYAAGNLPDFDPLMQAAGFSQTLVVTGGSESVAYSLLSTGLKSATLYYYVDGKMSKLLGACVPHVAMKVAAGGPLMLDFSAEGLYQGQVDTAFPTTQAFGTSIPPTSDNMAFSLFGYSGGIVRSFDCVIAGESTGPRPSLSAVAAVVPPRIRGRKISFTVVLENELQATKDFEAVPVANTLGVMSWSLATGAQYNKVAFTAPAARVDDVKYGNDKETEIATITGEFFDSVGNDAITLTFT